ncbi:MAG: O-antigen ligase family protein, partial [Deltaproteobacteria bacterium]
MYGWPLLQVVVYGALISLMAEANQKSMPMPKTPAIMLAVGLWFASIMSHAANGYFQGMLNTIPDTFKLSFFLVLLMVVMNSVDRLRGVVLMFLVAAVIMSIHALMQQSLGYGFGGGEPLRTYRKTGEVIYQSQFYGIFSDPNDMGQFLAASLPLAFAFPRRLIPVSFMLVAGIGWLIVEAMFSTYSRGTLIGVIAMGACLVFLRFPTRWMPYMAVLGLMGGLVVCATQGSVLLDQSARERVVFWGDANRVFKQYPLFGIGYGMFEDVVTEKSRASHNAYVSCYTELGFFGYWFWFNLITLGAIGYWLVDRGGHVFDLFARN